MGGMPVTFDSAGPSCPICGKPVDTRYRPFCSKRCADVDLNRWLSGVYVIPGREEGNEDDARPPTKPDNDEF
jgi:endogenous inhibitor of DNA gyrase (YacG/DUF329 family)